MNMNKRPEKSSVPNGVTTTGTEFLNTGLIVIDFTHANVIKYRCGMVVLLKVKRRVLQELPL